MNDWTKKTVWELMKHAERDDCYTCKQLLRAMHIDPDKLAEFLNVDKDRVIKILEEATESITTPKLEKEGNE
jgi:hypothetical protein